MKVVAWIIATAVIIGIWALFVWGVSFLIGYVTGYDLGFLRTAGAMFLLSVLSGLLLGNLKDSAN